MYKKFFNLVYFEIISTRFFLEVTLVTFLSSFYFIVRSTINEEKLLFLYQIKDKITYCSLDQYYLTKIILNYNRSLSLLMIFILVLKVFRRDHQKEILLPLSEFKKNTKGIIANSLFLGLGGGVLFCFFMTFVALNFEDGHRVYISISMEDLGFKILWQNFPFVVFSSIFLETLILFLKKRKLLLFPIIIVFLIDKSLNYFPGHDIYKTLIYECTHR